MFSESEFLAGILVLDIRYEHPGCQNINLFYAFNDQLDYILTHYFAELGTRKRNFNKSLFNLLINSITKKLLYCNKDE